jgi:hypothetical protein
LLSPSSSLILIPFYDDKVRNFDAKDTNYQGIVLPQDGLSETQLNILTDSMTELRDFHYSHGRMFHLRLDNDEDVRSLRLICDHNDSWEQFDHLKQFLYLRHYGIYVPEWMTKQSLSSSNECQAPFMIEMENESLAYWLLREFNFLVRLKTVNPHTLENLHLLAKKEHLNIKMYRSNIVRGAFLRLSQEEQSEIVHSYTPEQIKNVMECGWDEAHPHWQTLYLERVRNNLPISDYSLVIKFECDSKIYSATMTISSMTLNEAECFQRIFEKTQFVVPEDVYISSGQISPFVYLYFQLGAANFEELLYYLRDYPSSSCKNGDSIVKMLCNSTKFQESIITLSKQDCELPLSLKLELYDLDGELCTK